MTSSHTEFDVLALLIAVQELLTFFFFSFVLRGQVCSTKNVTFASECELKRQRCLCHTEAKGCADESYAHAHIDYYGPCVGRFTLLVSLTKTGFMILSLTHCSEYIWDMHIHA